MRCQRSCLSLALSLALVACGGGGGEGASQQTGAGPLAKYLGTYTGCKDHIKSTLVMASRDAASISVTQTDEYYPNQDCTGALLATSVMSAPLTAAYLSTGVAAITGWPAPNDTASQEVDRVEVRFPPGFKTALSGSGVVTIDGEQCIQYSPAQTVCFASDPQPAPVVAAGFALTSNGVLLMSATPTGYELDLALQR